MKGYILSIDQGTTSSRAMIFDESGKVVGKGQQEFKQIYPHPGWVEHDPEEIWRSVLAVIELSLADAGIVVNQIKAIGITNQRETTVLWDKKSGKPVYNAIVWQCRRTSEMVQNLKKEGYEELFKSKTGLMLDPYFSGTKLKWLFDNVEGIRKKAEKGELLFGTIDTWLIWKLTGGRVHVSDYTNACRTLLFNIHQFCWDEELLDILKIPAAILPELKSCSEVYGTTNPDVFFGTKVPISGIAGDQQAATFGQGCFEKGMTKITYGTGAFMLMNTGENAVSSENGLLTTISWGLNGKITYALEGSIFVAGAAVQWLRDELCLIDESADTEYFAEKVMDTNGVYIVPAFTGLGAPHWDPDARGTVVGLSRGCNKNHLIRATLESLVYQSNDVLCSMVEDSGIELKEIKVDGGAAANNFLIQFLADISRTGVERPVNTETTAIGAAFLAGLAVGYWSDFNEIIKIRKVDKYFEPDLTIKKSEKLIKGWQKAVETALYWSEG
ncbi:MAG TPA: glycerol kinase GlpK [Halanaerobiales bacterium]|nr:glycerol kinase GlpK [Halanaerobiales bacterium]